MVPFTRFLLRTFFSLKRFDRGRIPDRSAPMDSHQFQTSFIGNAMRNFPKVTVWLGAIAVVAAHAADEPWLPPLGEYKIDSTTTTRWSTPTGVMERVEQVDGDTGQATITQQGPDLPKPVVSTVPGKGPIRHCQIAGAPPVTRGNCTGKLTAQGDGASANVPCAGQDQDFEFRKVGVGVWEKRIRVAPSSGPQVQGNLPPQAMAAMAAMAAKMEARAKVAPPAEANALRQQMASMQQQAGAPTSNAPTVENVQRWTWVSNQCTARP
jgi:hypothetical protein